MSESHTAQILLFPAPTPSPSVQREPTEAEARLSRALIALNEALTVQRAAVASWKASLGELSESTGRLGASLRTYNDSLTRLDGRVADLRAESTRLEAWADTVLAEQS